MEKRDTDGSYDASDAWPMLPSARSALRMRDIASSMREDAAESRLSIWLERLAQPHNDHAFLELSLDAALSLGGGDQANLQLLDPRRGWLELVAQRGFAQPFIDFFRVVSNEATACALALRTGMPVTVPDITSSAIFSGQTGLEVMLDAGVRAVRSLPLRSRGGAIVGVVSVHHRRVQTFVATDLSRLRVLADAIGARLESARTR